jgi:hypothetical protein
MGAAEQSAARATAVIMKCILAIGNRQMDIEERSRPRIEYERVEMPVSYVTA